MHYYLSCQNRDR